MTIKAVELTRNIRDKMYEETKDMTKAEYLAYICQGNKQFQEKKTSKERAEQRLPLKEYG